MASAARESPLRRIANLPSKSNSPVEVDQDATTPSSPKKVATPRKEFQVKRGATLKLCHSCENHNEDVMVKPRVAKTADGEVAKRTRAAKRNAEAGTKGQTADRTAGTSSPFEKKAAAAKKPKEAKKKAITQGDNIVDANSTLKNSRKEDRKRSHRLEKEKKSGVQLKKDTKVHIGRISTDSGSSTSLCSCSNYTDKSNSSVGHHKRWNCMKTQRDPSSNESSSDESESNNSSSSSSSADEKLRRFFHMPRVPFAPNQNLRSMNK